MAVVSSTAAKNQQQNNNEYQHCRSSSFLNLQPVVLQARIDVRYAGLCLKHLSNLAGCLLYFAGEFEVMLSFLSQIRVCSIRHSGVTAAARTSASTVHL
jgi:hypothetical protein